MDEQNQAGLRWLERIHANQEKALEMQREQLAMVKQQSTLIEQQMARAESIQEKAENIQAAAGKGIKILFPALMIVVLLLAWFVIRMF